MTEAATILNAAGPQSLVVMDEIGRGTSTFDGLALAHSIAERLLQHNRAMVLFATHYFELTQLAATSAAAINLHLAAAEHQGGVVFLHEVRPGPASRSYGLQVARLAGLPAAVLKKAGALLDQLEDRARARDDQLDLFAGNNPDEPAADLMALDLEADMQPSLAQRVLHALREIDPDALNPRQALDELYRLQALLSDANTPYSDPS